MTIRDGTKYEEVIGVRREWIHPWRSAAIRGASGGTPPVYYDIAILELGKRVLMRISLRRFSLKDYFLTWLFFNHIMFHAN